MATEKSTYTKCFCKVESLFLNICYQNRSNGKLKEGNEFRSKYTIGAAEHHQRSFSACEKDPSFIHPSFMEVGNSMGRGTVAQRYFSYTLRTEDLKETREQKLFKFGTNQHPGYKHLKNLTLFFRAELTKRWITYKFCNFY